jgi:hypothetical protein
LDRKKAIKLLAIDLFKDKEKKAMSAEMEQKMLETIYDHIWQAITFSPGAGKMPAFNRETSFVQLNNVLLGNVLNPDDFKNLYGPTNVTAPDMLATEQFSRMVDVIPPVSADFKPTANVLSDTYKNIVNGANSSVQEDPHQRQLYNLAWDYLHDDRLIGKDVFGNDVIEKDADSDIVVNYESNRTAYTTAAGGYKTAYLNYNLNDPREQRQWLASAPLLQLAIDQAYNKWRRGGAALVEQAQAMLDTSINSGVRMALADARKVMHDSAILSFMEQVHTPWYLAYAMPSNWASPTAKNFAPFVIDTSRLLQTTNERFRSYGGGGGWFGGLITIGGGASGSSSQRQYHLETQQFRLEAESLTVRLFRPWLNSAIFRMGNWWNDAYRQHQISNGKLQGNENSAIPLIANGFTVLRNMRLTANFTQEDRQIITEQLRAGVGLSIGPFCLGGRYSHSKTESSFTTDTAGTTWNIPGLQIIAWISEIVPPSPLENPR